MKMEATIQQRLSEVVARERDRLRSFVLGCVDDEAEADDIVSDAFFALFEATRLAEPIEQAGAWLYRVARNRIIDRFRRRKPEVSLSAPSGEAGEAETVEDLLPSQEAGPEAAFAREVLLEELDEALTELPEAQRDVFLAHEVDGLSFKEISALTGVGVNTLLSRKHDAVLHLRARLREIYEEMEEGRKLK